MWNLQSYSTQCIEQDDIEVVLRTLRAKNLTQGPLIEEFEERLSDLCGVKYALAFNSATSALYAAYKSCNIKGSAITTPISFVATSNMLIQNGITPIFCDITQDGNLDPISASNILQTHSKKVGALVTTDYAGRSVDRDSIKKICSQYNCKFISDSSHSLGSQYKGNNIAKIADATVFSFHPIKPITTLEGGALLCQDSDIYEKAKIIRSHGIVRQTDWEYDVVENGFNFRMTEPQAALGISQLKKLDRFLQIREQIARFYDDFFFENPYFTTPHKNFPYTSSNHLYTILLNPKLWDKKLLLLEKLKQNNIGTQIHYKPIYKLSFYKKLGYKEVLKTADAFYQSTLSIPCHQKMTLKDAKICSETILKICEELFNQEL